MLPPLGNDCELRYPTSRSLPGVQRSLRNSLWRSVCNQGLGNGLQGSLGDDLWRSLYVSLDISVESILRDSLGEEA